MIHMRTKTSLQLIERIGCTKKNKNHLRNNPFLNYLSSFPRAKNRKIYPSSFNVG